MRYISILLVAGLSLGIYYFFLKYSTPGRGGNTVVTQEISTTAVEMDLTAIAQSERMYYVQNGSYASMDQLVSSGTMNINRDGRDGYTYAVSASSAGFTVTAEHPDIPAGAIAGSKTLHYPALSIDQNMQVQRGN